MSEDPQEKINNSHRYWSATCFNATWDLIDKSPKTSEDIEMMLHLAHASFWHWTQVPDVTQTNLSVGYWLLGRVYALAGKGGEALYYGNHCVDIGLLNQLEPFYIGYGYEAVARAYQILQKPEMQEESKRKAMACLEKITDEENKNLLIADLKQL